VTQSRVFGGLSFGGSRVWWDWRAGTAVAVLAVVGSDRLVEHNASYLVVAGMRRSSSSYDDTASSGCSCSINSAASH